MNSDWLLSREAVDAEKAGDASLGYSSSIWVAGWFQACFQNWLNVQDKRMRI